MEIFLKMVCGDKTKRIDTSNCAHTTNAYASSHPVVDQYASFQADYTVMQPVESMLHSISIQLVTAPPKRQPNPSAMQYRENVCFVYVLHVHVVSYSVFYYNLTAVQYQWFHTLQYTYTLCVNINLPIQQHSVVFIKNKQKRLLFIIMPHIMYNTNMPINNKTLISKHLLVADSNARVNINVLLLKLLLLIGSYKCTLWQASLLN